MTTLRQALYGVALLGALTLLLWGQYQRSQAEQVRTELVTERLQKVQERSDRQTATIVRLGGEISTQRVDQQGLQQTIDDLQQAYAIDRLKKKELKREDPHLQSWAAQPLPDAARSLHKRPAFTGANDYRQWLPSRNTLHAGSSSTGE